MKKTQYKKFLELLGPDEILVSEIALDLKIDKKNLFPSIRAAEAHGLNFKEKEANGGLYSIQLEPASWERLKGHLRREITYNGRKIWRYDNAITNGFSQIG